MNECQCYMCREHRQKNACYHWWVQERSSVLTMPPQQWKEPISPTPIKAYCKYCGVKR